MKKIKDIFNIDFWDAEVKYKNIFFGTIIKSIKILISTGQSYKKDNIPVRASSLTLFTMLSIVPFVAIVFGVAKGFGIEKSLRNLLFEKFANQQEVLEYVLQFAQNLLDNTKGGFIAAIGLAILFWSVLKVLGDIEHSFNAIWGIKKARNWARKFSDYFSILLIAPILIILSSSATVYITTSVNTLANEISLLGYFSPIIFFLLKCIPYLLLWLLFTFLYIVLPNTKVNFKSALIAGLVAGTIFQLTQWGYIHFQIGVSRYNSIYGSFAAFPLFLIWLNISWIIVLLGAELSFYHQNKHQIIGKTIIEKLSWNNRRNTIIYILVVILKNYTEQKRPLNLSKIAKTSEIEQHVLAEFISILESIGLISKVERDKSVDNFYIPTFDLTKITIAELIAKIDNHGLKKELCNDDKLFHSIKESINNLDKENLSSKSNKSISDM